MRVLKRIVYTTTVMNRTPPGTKVVPMFPDIEAYGKMLPDVHDDYDYILNCYKNQIPIPAVTSANASPEIGYLLEHDNRIYAVPKPYVKSFMEAHGIAAMDESPIGVGIVRVKNGIIITGNSQVAVSSDTVMYVYNTDEDNPIETRVPVCKSFRVKKQKGLQCITPKGLAVIPGVKLANEAILGVVRGEVIDVSWNKEYRCF